jgi:glycosyltransferase involved in cell wall biosynthesis
VRIALLALHFAEYAARLALALSAKHEVLLVLRSSNARNELTEDLRALLGEKVTVRSLEPGRMKDPRTLRTSLEVNRMLRDFAPDVLHIQEVHPVLVGWTLLSYRKRIPVVLTVHDPVHHSGGVHKTSWQWKIVTWFRRQATRVIVHGPRMQVELEELDGRIAGRVDVIPHGILGRADIDNDISRHEPGAFLFFGRVLAYKGLRYLLDAGDVLRSRGHHAFRLIVAGTGSDLELHRARIASSPWIELIDRYISAAEVPDLFRRAMAVVLPYTDATQSGVGAMALACSRPVIATDVGDVPDVVIDGRTGLIVPPRDENALADAMQKLLADGSLRDSLATGASRFAAEKLCWSHLAELTVGSYRRAINPHLVRQKDGNGSAAAGDQPANSVKLGILLDGKIQEGWVLDAVRQALSVPGVSLAAVALAGGIVRKSFASRLHGFLDRLDRRMRCRGERLFIPTHIPAEFDTPPLNVEVARHSDGWGLDEAGSAALRRCGVDAWLCFADHPPRRPMTPVSRLGVWGIEIGQDVSATSIWSGAMELGAESPVTMVNVVDYAEPRDGLLSRTYGATITNSFRRNRLLSLRKGVSFYRRILERLTRNEEVPRSAKPGMLTPARYPALREPTVSAVGRVFWRLASNVAFTRLRSLNWRDQWQIGYYFTDEDEVGCRFERLRYLVPPKDRFWADPFAVEHEGRSFIFFEELTFRTQKGRIMAIEVFENGEPGEPQVALERPYHLSYPFVFSWEGSLYMMPETAANGTLEVYRCEGFPLQWRLHRILLQDISAYDATLWKDDERWWMFVNVAEPEADSSDELHLYWSASPLGPWTAHRANPVVSDVRRARPAGPLFSRDGMLYRPSQDCSRAYGHCVLINRVDILNEDEYRETTVDRISPGWRKDILHVHTLGGSQRLRVVDYLVSRQQRF